MYLQRAAKKVIFFSGSPPLIGIKLKWSILSMVPLYDNTSDDAHLLSKFDHLTHTRHFIRSTAV